ncbi:hypothetical protein [Bradyrhizobium sp. CCBAU 051011]|uniref:IS66 family transposase n=1 Tax=Bradyrhizobium sp. CCBAU 051011 TaxID=858422 RepID=UPI00137967DC|nr:hypothetical protein [Bradyrhizobium sp. CCBAU 051011]
MAAEAEAQGALLIEKLKLTIKKLRHEQFGQSSEQGALLEQLELKLANVEETAAQAKTAAQMAAEKIAAPSSSAAAVIETIVNRRVRAQSGGSRQRAPHYYMNESSFFNRGHGVNPDRQT